MSFNSTLRKAQNSLAVSLNTVVAGTTTAGPVLFIDQSRNVEFESLVLNVTTAITTNTLTVVTLIQVSDDNTNWRTLFPMNGAAYVQQAAAGTGGAVTTNYCVSLNGWNPCKPFVRAAVLSGVATGGAADIVTMSWNFRQRFVAATG